jgi:transcriptional regulator with XRE-family HTH domain
MVSMTGNELRQRITRLGLTYAKAAELLGLSLSGLNHQMRDYRRVTRQTEMLLEQLERGCRAPPAHPRRGGR